MKEKIMKTPTLDQVLQYQNSDIVARFVKNYGVSTEEATTLFDDVKRWLWIAHEANRDVSKKSFTIDQSIIVIDEMWHNFVLFTKEYAEFCQQFFGRYLHHAPFPDSKRAAAENEIKHMNLREKKQYLMDKKRWQYEYIYDKLGEDTFIRWYKEYPKKFSPLALAEMFYVTEKKRAEEKLTLIEENESLERKIA